MHSNKFLNNLAKYEVKYKYFTFLVLLFTFCTATLNTKQLKLHTIYIPSVLYSQLPQCGSPYDGCHQQAQSSYT